MEKSFQGDNLIFLISQPRAGSTLLQRILGSHPEIHTASEPWLMLHPCHALRTKGQQTDYNTLLARGAVQEFFKELPNGEDDYIQGLRRMYGYLYERALSRSGRNYFLDKTPRYYSIIPEIYRTFPQAKYIILLRNPLAVLCSILTVWIQKDWLYLYRFKDDLIHAPGLLLEGKGILRKQCVIVHYEQLVANPESEVRQICDTLGFDFLPDMIEYGRHSLSRWSYGDQKEVYNHSRPVSLNAVRWTDLLNHTQTWRLTNDYLQMLGNVTIGELGYSYTELQQALDNRRPHLAQLWATCSLERLLRKPVQERKRWDHHIVRFTKCFQDEGVMGLAIAAARKLGHALRQP